MDVELKMKKKIKNRRKRKAKRKRRLTVNKLEVYGRPMEGREYKDLSSMNMQMTKVGDELNVLVLLLQYQHNLQHTCTIITLSDYCTILFTTHLYY